MPLVLIVVIVVGAFLTGNRLIEYQSDTAEKQQVVAPEQVLEATTPTNTPTPTPTSAPQVKGQDVQREPVIDCTGPDGKHLRITQKECDNFNAVWGKKNRTVDCEVSPGMSISEYYQVKDEKGCEEARKSYYEAVSRQNANRSNTQSLTPEDVKNMILTEQIKQSINQGISDQKLEAYQRCLDKVATDLNQCYKDCESKGTYWDDIVCEYAYGANGVVSKSNLNLYSQCLEQQGKAYLDCKVKCNSSYQFTSCPR